jgi:hypothetical protein
MVAKPVALWHSKAAARVLCPVCRLTLLGCGCSSGVEHNLAKVGVEGSNPFARSKNDHTDLRGLFAWTRPRQIDRQFRFHFAQRFVDDPHLRTVPQIEQSTYRIFRHAKSERCDHAIDSITPSLTLGFAFGKRSWDSRKPHQPLAVTLTLQFISISKCHYPFSKSFVIPGPSEARSPESIIPDVQIIADGVKNLTVCGYGFRARRLRPRPGMTGVVFAGSAFM